MPGGEAGHRPLVARPALAYYRRNLPHLQSDGRTIFVTFATYRRWVIPESLRSVVLASCVHEHGVKLWLHGAVVMPDHVHLVFTPLEDPEGNPFGMAEILGAIKGATAHTLNRTLGRQGRVWQEESWDRIVRRGESIRQIVEYICQNPLQAGLAASEDHYPWLWREWIEGSSPDRSTAPRPSTAEGGCAPWWGQSTAEGGCAP